MATSEVGCRRGWQADPRRSKSNGIHQNDFSLQWLSRCIIAEDTTLDMARRLVSRPTALKAALRDRLEIAFVDAREERRSADS